MQFLRLLAPAALVALASAQYYNDEQFDILARDEAPGYDDLGFFIRDVDHDNNLFDLKTREADSELLFSEDTDITLSAREADQFGDFDALIALAERDAEADAEPLPEPKKKKRKSKKKGKKRKGKGRKKNKKGKKGKGKKKQSKAAKKKAAAAKKLAKEDDDVWG